MWRLFLIVGLCLSLTSVFAEESAKESFSTAKRAATAGLAGAGAATATGVVGSYLDSYRGLPSPDVRIGRSFEVVSLGSVEDIFYSTIPRDRPGIRFQPLGRHENYRSSALSPRDVDSIVENAPRVRGQIGIFGDAKIHTVALLDELEDAKAIINGRITELDPHSSRNTVEINKLTNQLKRLEGEIDSLKSSGDTWQTFQRKIVTPYKSPRDLMNILEYARSRGLSIGKVEFYPIDSPRQNVLRAIRRGGPVGAGVGVAAWVLMGATDHEEVGEPEVKEELLEDFRNVDR